MSIIFGYWNLYFSMMLTKSRYGLIELVWRGKRTHCLQMCSIFITYLRNHFQRVITNGWFQMYLCILKAMVINSIGIPTLLLNNQICRSSATKTCNQWAHDVHESPCRAICDFLPLHIWGTLVYFRPNENRRPPNDSITWKIICAIELQWGHVNEKCIYNITICV